jgi:hypothetical protein
MFDDIVDVEQEKINVLEEDYSNTMIYDVKSDDQVIFYCDQQLIGVVKYRQEVFVQ